MGELPAKLEWIEGYRTGIATLDGQHLTIMLLYNDVLRALKSGASRIMVTETVDTLIAFVRRHMAWEERMMAAIRTDRAAEHEAAHQAFESVAKAFYHYLGAADGVGFATFASHWIVEHILLDRDITARMTIRPPVGAGSRLVAAGASARRLDLLTL